MAYWDKAVRTSSPVRGRTAMLLRRVVRRTVLLFGGTTMACAAIAVTATPSRQTDDYAYYVIGQVDEHGVAINVEVPLPQKQAIVLEGGDVFVPAATAWMVERAGGGNFLVLRAKGGDWYNRAITQRVGGVASVETIVTRTREAASDPFVLDRVAKADTIFISGGDQADYVRLWQDTPLQRAINDAVRERRVPIGGTSAGMMILGQFAFGALAGSVGSREILGRPDDPRITMVRDLLTIPYLSNTVTDSHLVSRDRLGRMMTFMARTIVDGWASMHEVRAIGVGGRAALMLEDGVARVAGEGAVFVMRPLDTEPLACGGTAMPFRSVQVFRLDPRVAFDIGHLTSLSDVHVVDYKIELTDCSALASSLDADGRRARPADAAPALVWRKARVRSASAAGARRKSGYQGARPLT